MKTFIIDNGKTGGTKVKADHMYIQERFIIFKRNIYDQWGHKHEEFVASFNCDNIVSVQVES